MYLGGCGFFLLCSEGMRVSSILFGVVFSSGVIPLWFLVGFLILGM